MIISPKTDINGTEKEKSVWFQQQNLRINLYEKSPLRKGLCQLTTNLTLEITY